MSDRDRKTYYIEILKLLGYYNIKKKLSRAITNNASNNSTIKAKLEKVFT